MRTISRTLILLAALAAAGCSNPRAQANMAQALNDAAAEMNALRSDIGQIQTDLDSLRTVVAKQDSLISRIAAVNNIPR
jgi:septal ring factor EnvC (AmiA/AmiB activator)